MKNCEHEGCNETIEDKYHYCYAHYKTSNKVKSPPVVPEVLPEGMWAKDPVVDALLKINSNLGSIKRLLEQRQNNEHEERVE